MVLVYAEVLSEHAKVIKSDFKPGSIEKSIDLDEGVTSASNNNSSIIRVISASQ
jgi:hypothetical protein